jgi:hypothetical protein
VHLVCSYYKNYQQAALNIEHSVQNTKYLTKPNIKFLPMCNVEIVVKRVQSSASIVAILVLSPALPSTETVPAGSISSR